MKGITMGSRYRIEAANEGDTVGHIYINFDRTGRVGLEDAEGHVYDLGVFVADDDTEGHGTRHLQPAGEDEDAEGHSHMRFVPTGDDGSTEGHRHHLRIVPEGDDEAEGHRVHGRVEPAGDEDVEGHARAR
jgi:hypothetical protein